MCPEFPWFNVSTTHRMLDMQEVLADAMDDNEHWFADRVNAGDFEPWVRSN